MATLAISIDCLRNDRLVPLENGLRLFPGLVEAYSVNVLTNGTRPEADLWLKNRGLKGYARIIGDEVVPRTGESLRVAQISTLRTFGPVDLVIDSDPGVIAWAMATGSPGMLHMHPNYSRPEFRPDAPKQVRRWDEIQAELDRQEKALATDKRLLEDADQRWE